MTDNLLARKLGQVVQLSAADLALLDGLSERSYTVGSGEDIIKQGDEPRYVHLVLDGIVCRNKVLPNGDRAIVGLLLPGDLCDLHIAILGRMDHNISALSDCRIVDIPHRTVVEMTSSSRRLAMALWWATLVDEAILREWLVGLGRRRADRRAAHLLCEILARLEAVGRGQDRVVPLGHQQLADVLGITSVHLHRVLGTLKSQGLIVQQDRRIVVNDVAALREYGQFDPDYLHRDDNLSPLAEWMLAG
ncbi:Crp/Fnr family transcriptional regulator (plasmid) [Paracoccus liaowanqingii]|uniref:Crp/Fnr family transcriptional regulator n=1 Tax=Paracoccus liaowanqingii TaxID=2560053 RepID=A0A4Y5ST39_9RHOB|nr:Crp/Fnr family transcriptional regulator [Paracoccus liaowanqingii]QDA36687.1 Crp/Fnr family transcriptional regulator [Paracoccus liaowanqingii]